MFEKYSIYSQAGEQNLSKICFLMEKHSATEKNKNKCYI